MQYTDKNTGVKIEYLKGKIVSTTTTDREESFNPYLNQFPDYLVELENKATVTVFSNALKYKPGTEVYIEKVIQPGISNSYYTLNEKIRYPELIFSILFFMIFIIAIFGKKGVKSLFSLFVSISIIWFILLPLMLNGYNPIIVASFISIILLTTMMLISNGRNKITYAAISGCIISAILTIFLSYIVVNYSAISGQTDDYWGYFAFSVKEQISFSLLVIASMIIGVIGAVDDGAITQATVVAELKSANNKLLPYKLYKRAMRVGSSHAGAMINTLVLAYIGASLPLFLYIYVTPIPLGIMVNREIVSTEIFRSIIGSIGLLTAIPITTLISVYLFRNDKYVDVPDRGHRHEHKH